MQQAPRPGSTIEYANPQWSLPRHRLTASRQKLPRLGNLGVFNATVKRPVTLITLVHRSPCRIRVLRRFERRRNKVAVVEACTKRKMHPHWRRWW